MIVSFVVLGSPVPQARPRISGGRAWTPERSRNWRDLVAWRAKEVGLRPTGEPVGLILGFALNHSRRTDVDNLAKAVMDALEGIAYNDDSQVCALIVTRCRVAEPFANVTIRTGRDLENMLGVIEDREGEWPSLATARA